MTRGRLAWRPKDAKRIASIDNQRSIELISLLPLCRHPDSVSPSITSIFVSVAREAADVLILSYRMEGRISELSLPPSTMAVRTDGLWKTTCCEAFVRAGDNSSYAEFNFSPSTRWAAYRFSAYREGMRAVTVNRPPEIRFDGDEGVATLVAALDLGSLGGNAKGQPVRLGLSVVVEDGRGDLSYWAFRHPPGKPDFHHGDGLALQIAASELS
jgi:hypothetical protein